jgi:hypothetical protein
MRIFARGLAWVTVVLLSAGGKAQQPREIVEQAVKTELAADAADHSLWLYYDTIANQAAKWLNGRRKRAKENWSGCWSRVAIH